MSLDVLMKEWLLECFQEDCDQEEIEELSTQELMNAVDRYFDGGMRAFVECCSAWK
jgi:hypothetical protein